MWSTERKHDIGDNNVISRAGEDVLAMKIDRLYIVRGEKVILSGFSLYHGLE